MTFEGQGLDLDVLQLRRHLMLATAKRPASQSRDPGARKPVKAAGRWQMPGGRALGCGSGFALCQREAAAKKPLHHTAQIPDRIIEHWSLQEKWRAQRDLASLQALAFPHTLSPFYVAAIFRGSGCAPAKKGTVPHARWVAAYRKDGQGASRLAGQLLMRQQVRACHRF